MTSIRKTTGLPQGGSIVLLGSEQNALSKYPFTKQEKEYISRRLKESDKKLAVINYTGRIVFVQLVTPKKEQYQTNEACRKAGSDIAHYLNAHKIKEITVADVSGQPAATLAFAEGMALGNYQFLKYKSDAKKEAHSLTTIHIQSGRVTDKQLAAVQIAVDATSIARTLVNEPVNFLNATQLSKEFEKLGKEAGFNVEVFNKSKITSLKMGGLLAVNKGSIDPPTFTIMEYKPRGAKNKKPYVLVGKGVVYDTGGLSLKPTPNSMDTMKCDMAGAAAVGGTMYAIAKAKLPVHVIGLVPATDNRPGENAYVPGDVIEMMSGLKVEMLNADAEGRMILADALHYAKRYEPQLVIDLATLTGAAAAAIGKFGIVSMGTAGEGPTRKLKQSGNNVYERLAEMPFWEEYGDLIKSPVADIKNIGGPHAGAITAGKFLEHFTSYPWIHLDIAGPSFLTAGDSYRPYGGTGVGVRLLFDFFKNS